MDIPASMDIPIHGWPAHPCYWTLIQAINIDIAINIDSYRYKYRYRYRYRWRYSYIEIDIDIPGPPRSALWDRQEKKKCGDDLMKI